MKTVMPVLSRLGLVFAAVIGAMNASAASEQVFNGRVVEHDGGKPVAGAFVFATWDHQGADLVGSRTSCVRMEIVRTDEAGRFSFPLPVFGTEPGVQVFAAHYQQYFPSPSMTESEIRAANRLVEVVPFTGPPKARLHLYNAISSLRTCHSDNKVDTLMPLYQAVDKEASELGIQGNFVRMLGWLKREQDEGKARREIQE